jgi:hypothetical protein
MSENFRFSTKIWRRGRNSFATTIPQNILAIKSVPVEKGATVDWSINPDTGKVELEFRGAEDE